MTRELDRMKQSQVDTRKMLAEWRANNNNEVELPLSGHILKVRDVGLIDLAVSGSIPNTMMDLVQQLTEGKITEMELLKEHAVEFGRTLDMIFLQAVVYPPVAEEPDEDHISPRDFVYGDKMALFNWVNREAKIVRPFRKEPGEPVAAASNGKDIREETE